MARIPNGEQINRFLKIASRAKKNFPKEYQSLKDAVYLSKKALSGVPGSFGGRVWNKPQMAMIPSKFFKSSSDARAAAMKISRTTSPKSSGRAADTILKAVHTLYSKGILPSAAAGAGVAASRKPKAQGYKYGGMVKRSRKGC